MKCKVCGVVLDDLDCFMIRESGLCFTHYNEGPGKERPAIHEEDKLDEAWFKKADKIKTPKELAEFLNTVMNGYVHDYGTVCKAIAVCAYAAAWCANSMEGANGGITGFQSGAVFWQFARRWLRINGPARLQRYENMLYPQYFDQFEKKLDKSVAGWLREEALKKLESAAEGTHQRVVAHWQKLATGELPFGYTLSKDPNP